MIEEVVWEIIKKTEGIKLTDEQIATKISDKLVIERLEDRKKKFQAPNASNPVENEIQQYVDLMKQFEVRRNRLINYVKESGLSFRSYGSENPVLGLIDIYQWTLFASAHTVRHTKQIREIMENEAFNKL